MYLKAQLPELVEGRLNAKLHDTKNGMTRCRSVEGVLPYGVLERPEHMGKLACLQTRERDATWNDVRRGSQILSEMNADSDDCSLWYPPMVESPPQPDACKSRMRLLVIYDSAFKDAADKYSQGAYCLCLCERLKDGPLGGRMHLIHVSSRKARRVAKGTWSAELLSRVTGLERLEVAQG